MSLTSQHEWLFEEDNPSKGDFNLDSEFNDVKRGKKRTLNDDIKEDEDENCVKLNPNECFLDFERDMICKVVDKLYTATSDSIHDNAIFDFIKKNQVLAEKNITAKCGVFKLFMNTKDTINNVKDDFYYGSFDPEMDGKRLDQAYMLVDSIKNVTFNSSSKEKKTWDFSFYSTKFGVLVASTPVDIPGRYESLIPFNASENAARQVSHMVLEKCVQLLKEKQSKWKNHLIECRRKPDDGAMSVSMSAENERMASRNGFSWMPLEDQEFINFINVKDDIAAFCDLELVASSKPFYISRIFKSKDNKLKYISVENNVIVNSESGSQLKNAFYSGKVVMIKVNTDGKVYLQFYSKTAWSF